MRLLTEWLQKSTGIPAELYGKLITYLVCLLLLWLFRWLVLKGVWRRTENSRTRYQWRKISNYVVSALAFLLLGRVLDRVLQRFPAENPTAFRAAILISLRHEKKWENQEWRDH